MLPVFGRPLKAKRDTQSSKHGLVEKKPSIICELPTIRAEREGFDSRPTSSAFAPVSAKWRRFRPNDRQSRPCQQL
jgi:hypothetical protein